MTHRRPIPIWECPHPITLRGPCQSLQFLMETLFARALWLATPHSMNNLNTSVFHRRCLTNSHFTTRDSSVIATTTIARLTPAVIKPRRICLQSSLISLETNLIVLQLHSPCTLNQNSICGKTLLLACVSFSLTPQVVQVHPTFWANLSWEDTECTCSTRLTMLLSLIRLHLTAQSRLLIRILLLPPQIICYQRWLSAWISRATWAPSALATHPPWPRTTT